MKNNEEDQVRGILSTDLNKISMPPRRRIRLLDSIKNTVKETIILTEGEVKTCNDNKKPIKELEKSKKG